MATTKDEEGGAPADPDRLRRTIEEALPIARERRQLLDEIKDALEEGDDHAALTLMRRYLGLPGRGPESM